MATANSTTTATDTGKRGTPANTSKSAMITTRQPARSSAGPMRSDTRPESSVAPTPTSEYTVIISEPIASGCPSTLTVNNGTNARMP